MRDLKEKELIRLSVDWNDNAHRQDDEGDRIRRAIMKEVKPRIKGWGPSGGAGRLTEFTERVSVNRRDHIESYADAYIDDYATKKERWKEIWNRVVKIWALVSAVATVCWIVSLL